MVADYYSKKYNLPLEKLLFPPETTEDVLDNKIAVFLYRLPEILTLIRNITFAELSQRASLIAKFQEPMDPTGKWFPGTIYEAMESPLDEGLKVNKIVVDWETLETVGRNEQEETIRDLGKGDAPEGPFTKWGHVVHGFRRLLEADVSDIGSFVYFMTLARDNQTGSEENVQNVRELLTYGGLIDVSSMPLRDYLFLEGVTAIRDSGNWELYYLHIEE